MSIPTDFKQNHTFANSFKAQIDPLTARMY